MLAKEETSQRSAAIYAFLVRLVNEIGWEEFISLRKRVFVLQNETKIEHKTLINPWLDRLIGTLYEELRVIQALQNQFPRAEERSREEWQQLATLCQRMQRPQLELQGLQQVHVRTVHPDKALLYRLAQLKPDEYLISLQDWNREHKETDYTWRLRLEAKA